MNLKASFVDYLIQKYPQFNQELLAPLISENLLSPFQISLSGEMIESIRTEIKKYWKLRTWGSQNLNSQFEKYGLRKPNNYGVCMSYDFHISIENKLELIEINTNASFLALGLELYQFLGLKEEASDFTEQKIINMFLKENKLNEQKDLKLVIADESPEKQRLYVEFLIYQSLLKKNNLICEIADLTEIEKIKNSTLVYNRYTDFYLQEEKSLIFKNLFNEMKIQLSPNPYEYFLLADKERFIDWSRQTEVEKPSSLLPTYDLGKTDKEKVWSERKSLFFKPKNAFGSKQAYKGTSISRKVFEEVTNSNFIAQRISQAPEIEVDFKDQKLKLKYDLRCYAYQDELQLIIARLYQGQTTNLRTEGGGFACVIKAN
jgi:hypothetical protein